MYSAMAKGGHDFFVMQNIVVGLRLTEMAGLTCQLWTVPLPACFLKSVFFHPFQRWLCLNILGWSNLLKRDVYIGIECKIITVNIGHLTVTSYLSSPWNDHVHKRATLQHGHHAPSTQCSPLPRSLLTPTSLLRCSGIIWARDDGKTLAEKYNTMYIDWWIRLTLHKTNMILSLYCFIQTLSCFIGVVLY